MLLILRDKLAPHSLLKDSPLTEKRPESHQGRGGDNTAGVSFDLDIFPCQFVKARVVSSELKPIFKAGSTF